MRQIVPIAGPRLYAPIAQVDLSIDLLSRGPQVRVLLGAPTSAVARALQAVEVFERVPAMRLVAARRRGHRAREQAATDRVVARVGECARLGVELGLERGDGADGAPVAFAAGDPVLVSCRADIDLAVALP